MAKKRITRVYTRTGDEGITSLVGGTKVSKTALRVEAYGDVDELNAVLGIARQEISDPEIGGLITRIQNELFILGADLATPTDIEAPRIDAVRVEGLEKLIDGFLEELEPLKEFILPSGAGGAPFLHLSRTVARRAERNIARLMEQEDIGVEILPYVNRLSDLLFVMARIENQRNGFEEKYVSFKD